MVHGDVRFETIFIAKDDKDWIVEFRFSVNLDARNVGNDNEKNGEYGILRGMRILQEIIRYSTYSPQFSMYWKQMAVMAMAQETLFTIPESALSPNVDEFSEEFAGSSPIVRSSHRLLQDLLRQSRLARMTAFSGLVVCHSIYYLILYRSSTNFKSVSEGCPLHYGLSNVVAQRRWSITLSQDWVLESVAHIETIHHPVAIGTFYSQMDAKVAFINGSNDVILYIQQPENFLDLQFLQIVLQCPTQ